MTAEIRTNHFSQNGESPLLGEWQDIISRLPSVCQEQAQRLPENCQENVILLTTECNRLADEFPSYPFTPSDLAQVSGQLEERTSLFVQGLAGWGERPFIDIWLKKQKLLETEIERSGRKELAVGLSELISQDARNRFAGANRDSLLLDNCLEATRSFAGPSVAWAIVSDKDGFKKNFFHLLLPIYRLGACVVDIYNNYHGKEILVAEIPYIEGEEFRRKSLTAPLKTQGFLINAEVER